MMFRSWVRLFALAVFGFACWLPCRPSSAATPPDGTGRPDGAEDKVLFDFESETELKAWSFFSDADPKIPGAKEPPVKIELSPDNATSGKSSLKLTFAGGRFPTISTASPLVDWTPYKTFQADVTVSRTCLVIFRLLNDASSRGTAYNEGVSRWEFAARLQPGRNSIAALTPSRPAYKTTTTFDIYMYQPQEGETIYVDHIRLSAKPPQVGSPFLPDEIAPPHKFKVLGTDREAADASDLADQLKDQFVGPKDQTIEEVEAGIQAEFANLKSQHPQALLAIFRNGQKGYDPADPEKVFAGWEDAGTYFHGPMALGMTCFANRGQSEEYEATFRSRPPFFRIDLSSLPKDAEILAARLIVVRALEIEKKNWETKPTLFVAEPCNRPWKEDQVNPFEYQKHTFWQQLSGMSWEGDDPDFSPVFLAHGPSGGQTCAWDFSHAVRYWQGGLHDNHGFILYGARKYVDYLHIFSRKCKVLKNRPALLVIYEPKAGSR